MKIKYIASFIFISTAFSGCSEVGGGNSRVDANKAVEVFYPHEVDLSTPDRAIQSYWKSVDFLNESTNVVSERVLASATPYTEPKFSTMNDAMVMHELRGFPKSDEVLPVFSRQIEDVQMQTDSRAFVVAAIKNVTPLDSSQVLSEGERELRSEGGLYKYILEKGGDSLWRVSEIWSYDRGSDKFYKDAPAENSFRSKRVYYSELSGV